MTCKCKRANVKRIQFLDGWYAVSYIKLDLQYSSLGLMKIFLTSLVFLLSCIVVKAQQDRFIYLQTENQKPFFVKLNNRVYNSYPAGYLIIPKLDDGLYSLVVGFPDSSDEREFNCPINNNDAGFIIKNSGEKQWQLLNVQTNKVIVPGDVITKQVIAYEKETDPFSTMLANAVHDSTILRKDIPREVIAEKTNEQLQKDTAAVLTANTTVSVIQPANTQPADSANKDTSKEITAEKRVELKDSTLTALDPNNLISNSNVPADSVKKDIAKETVSEKDNIIPKDTAQGVINNDIVVLKPDTVNDVTKDPLAERSNAGLQTDSAQVVSNNDNTNKSRRKRAKKNDNALQDSSIAKADPVKEIVPGKITETNDSVQNGNPTNDLAFLRTIIKRRSKKNNKEGLEMVYIDDIGDTKDTITVLIPSDKKKKTDGDIKDTSLITAVTSTVQPDDKPKENTAEKSKDDYKLTRQEKQIIKEANKEPVFISGMINSDCKSFATEADFLKIRKKMVAEDNDEDMIKAAKKIFKTKCFTTEQIKNLSVLFLKDEGKYMFFDAAYPFVSDSDVYATLEKQLSDDYYVNRFRAMIHK